jgi:hypothetical protein
MYNGFGKHHGGHHGGGHFFNPGMMYPQYEPSTIEIITTGDDICTACRAKTVTGPACDRCPGIKYAGYGATADAVPSWLTVLLFGGVLFWLIGPGWKASRSSYSSRRHVRRAARRARRKGYKTRVTRSGGMYRVYRKRR